MKISAEKFFNKLEIPDTWNTLEEFMNWWIDVGMPFMPRFDHKVFLTDDASSFSIFKHKNFQNELYLIHPHEYVQEHSHPGVEVIQMIVGGSTGNPGYRSLGEKWGELYPLKSGEFHGSKDFDSYNGLVVFVFQKWPEGVDPISAAVAWRGKTAGPKHKDLIEEYFPGIVDEKGVSFFDEDMFAQLRTK